MMPTTRPGAENVSCRPETSAVGHRSKRITELFLGETGFANEGTECALGKLAVVGNGQPAASRMAQNNMAACLVVHFVTEILKGFDGTGTGADGQAAHTGTSTISSATGPGIGSLCFSILCR